MVEPLIKNDAVVLGILFIILALVFISSNSKNRWLLKFYKYVPSLLVCYFIPSILNSMGIISGDQSNLYFVASRYLLPASLVLLTISIDLLEIIKIRSKSDFNVFKWQLELLLRTILNYSYIIHIS